MSQLTVITTTYNRAYCLHQVYESLCRQTCKDFIWMIIDDGSNDNTKELIDGWIADALISIKYYYKPNGGMHTARNLAYEKVETELNVIIDSDDWMTDDSVELIINFWNEHKSEKIAGIVSYDITPNGEIVGSLLPENISKCTFTELVDKYKVTGDKKLIYRSDLTRLYPYPEFEGEKFFPASYKFRMLDQEYELLLMRENTCVVNYGEDSMSFHKIQQYKSCCKSFAFSRNELIRISNSPKYIVRQCIHYIAESKFAKDKHYIKNSAKPIYTIILAPIALMYYLYLKNKLRSISND